MNNPKKYLPEYLFFTRKERRGIIVIVVLVLFFIILPFLFPLFVKTKQVDHTAFEKEIAALNIKQGDSSGNYTNRNSDTTVYANEYHYQSSERNDYTKQQNGDLFYFDPNTLSAAGWLKLGVREKTANTIKNYTSKGGRFYKPGDIAKIWGLRQDEVNRLLPYVQIATLPVNNYPFTKTTESYKAYEKPKSAITVIDVNEADTAAFIALPGIGSKLANRIVAFRDRLGGFYKVEQVAETYALPDSVFQKIKGRLTIKNIPVKKININKATLDELKAHPYIRYTIANAIVQYRTLHGEFSDLSDLKKIMIISDDMYSKAAPYLTVK